MPTPFAVQPPFAEHIAITFYHASLCLSHNVVEIFVSFRLFSLRLSIVKRINCEADVVVVVVAFPAPASTQTNYNDQTTITGYRLLTRSKPLALTLTLTLTRTLTLTLWQHLNTNCSLQIFTRILFYSMEQAWNETCL